MSFLPKFKIASLLLVFRFLMFEISMRVFQGLIDVDGLFMICLRKRTEAPRVQRQRIPTRRIALFG
jgi:hypothetical protein